MLTNATFFVEAPIEWLSGRSRGAYLTQLFMARVFDRYTVAEALTSLNWGVSISSISLDSPTKEALALLAHNKVPITHWIVVDDVDGYWTNKKNLDVTLRKTDALVNWCIQNNLPIYRLGVDLEKPISILSLLAKGKHYEALKLLVAYYQSPQTLDSSVFWETFKSFGYPIEVYDFFRFIKPLLGGDVPYDKDMRVVEMLYTNGFPSVLQGTVAKMLHRPNTIPALGILNGLTGQTPGRDLGGGVLPRHLTPEDVRSVVNALPRQKEFYFFALNHPSVLEIVFRILNEYSYSHL